MEQSVGGRPDNSATRDQGAAPGTRVLVAADHTLVADSVAAALRDRGLRVGMVPLGLPHDGDDRAGECRGLLISELDSDRTVQRAQALLRGSSLRWTVLTGAPRGPMWGAVLEAGATLVIPSTAPLEQVCEVMTSGVIGPGVADSAGLLAAWRELAADRSDKALRLSSLSPRELEVLRLLYRGERVVQVATRLEIAPATVRSQVKAVLRKLGVNSQIAAVAVYGLVGTPSRIDPAAHGVRREASIA